MSSNSGAIPSSISVRDLTIQNPNQWATVTGSDSLLNIFNLYGVPPGINVFTGGVSSIQYNALGWQEVFAIMQAFSAGVKVLEKVAPSIAKGFKDQLMVAVAFGAIAKAKFQNNKVIGFPGQPGTIAVNWLSPQLLRYINAASATQPAYSDYVADTWNLSLTAGAIINFLGNTTWTQNTPGSTTTSTISVNNYYKANPINGQRQLSFILQDGMIEEASTPCIDQLQILTQNEQKYGPYTVEPLRDQTIESNKTIYQIPTPVGVIPLWYDVGTVLIGMPFNTQTSTIKLHGLSFYENELLPNVTYV